MSTGAKNRSIKNKKYEALTEEFVIDKIIVTLTSKDYAICRRHVSRS